MHNVYLAIFKHYLQTETVENSRSSLKSTPTSFIGVFNKYHKYIN